MLDHANGAPAPFIGGRRIRYAWKPVRQYVTLTRPGGWLWLQEVVEMRTLGDGWVALEHDNRGSYTLTVKTALMGTAAHLLIAFTAIAVAIGPLVAQLPQMH